MKLRFSKIWFLCAALFLQIHSEVSLSSENKQSVIKKFANKREYKEANQFFSETNQMWTDISLEIEILNTYEKLKKIYGNEITLSNIDYVTLIEREYYTKSTDSLKLMKDNMEKFYKKLENIYYKSNDYVKNQIYFYYVIHWYDTLQKNKNYTTKIEPDFKELFQIIKNTKNSKQRNLLTHINLSKEYPTDFILNKYIFRPRNENEDATSFYKSIFNFAFTDNIRRYVTEVTNKVNTSKSTKKEFEKYIENSMNVFIKEDNKKYVKIDDLSKVNSFTQSSCSWKNTRNFNKNFYLVSGVILLVICFSATMYYIYY